MGYILSLVFFVFGCVATFRGSGTSDFYICIALSAAWAIVGEFGSLVNWLEEDEDREEENE